MPSDTEVVRGGARGYDRLRFLPFFVALVLSTLSFGQIEVAGEQGPTGASSGETVTLRLALRNVGGSQATVAAGAELPPGWRLLVPIPAITLEAGESAVLLATIVIPPSASAGEYEVAVDLTQRSGGVTSVRRQVRVAELRSIEAYLVSNPDWGPGEGYEVVFAVRNLGNSTEEVTLEIVGNEGFRHSLAGPSGRSLPPGATEEVRVAVTPPADLTAPLTHVLNLHVKRSGEVVAVASASTRIAASSFSPRLAERTFPLTVETSVTLDSSRDGLTPQLPIDELGVRLHGSGRLHENEPGVLSLNLSASIGGAGQKNLVSYRDPRLLLEIGDASAGSALLPKETGFGVTVSTPGSTDSRHRLRATTVIGGSPFWEVEAASVVTDGLELRAGGRFGREHSFAVGGADLDVHPGPGTSISLSASPALDLTTLAPGFDLHLEFEGREVEATADWTYLSAGYGEIPVSENSYEMAAVVPLDTDAGDYEVYAGYWNSTDTNGSRGAQFELQRRGERMDWSVGYQGYLPGDDPARSHRRELYFRSVFESRPLTLMPHLRWGRAWRPDDSLSSATIEGGLEVQSRIFGWAARPLVEFEYDLLAGVISKVELGADWESPPWEGAELRLYGSATLLKDQQITVGARAEGDVGGGRTLSADLTFKSNEQQSGRLQARLAMASPLQVPLGRRHDIGQVSGRVIDGAGQGLPGLHVRLAGYVGTTGADGSFHFPAIPSGAHALSVSGLQPARAVQPQLPLLLDVTAGASISVDIQVFESSMIRALARVRETNTEDQDESALVRPTLPTDRKTLLQGLVVVIDDAAHPRQALLGADGVTPFSNLVPGDWQVSILPESVPDGFRVEPAQVRVDLIEGTTREVEFELVPVVRRIRFMEGGEVGN